MSNSDSTIDLHLPRVIAHRGAPLEAPENTLAALQRAYEIGASWVEFDVMLTADGVPIIIHDDRLDRTTNGHGKVAAKTYAEIAELDAGLWFNPRFQGEKVPTLVQFLSCAAKLGLGINVEIKPTVGREAETAEAAVRVIEANWPEKNKLLISSFSEKSLAVVHSINSKLPLGFLLHHWTKHWQQAVADLNCFSLHAFHRILTPARIAEIKNQGLHVLAYTVDSPVLAKKLFSWGVDAVFSNKPDFVLTP